MLEVKFPVAAGNQTTFGIVDPQCSLVVHKEIVDFYGFEFGGVARLEIGEIDAIKSCQTAVQCADPKVAIGRLSDAGDDSLGQAGIRVPHLYHEVIVQSGRQ